MIRVDMRAPMSPSEDKEIVRMLGKRETCCLAIDILRNCGNEIRELPETYVWLYKRRRSIADAAYQAYHMGLSEEDQHILTELNWLCNRI